jgi:hypothetical protein
MSRPFSLILCSSKTARPNLEAIGKKIVHYGGVAKDSSGIIEFLRAAEG